MVTAVTGDIGAGKSAFSKLLAEKLNCKLIDADKIVLTLWNKTEIKDKAVSRWGRGILNAEGEIIKSKISEYIFSDENEWKFCGKLLHPLVMAELKTLSRKFDTPVIEIPLLFEAGGKPEWIDDVIYVTASFEIRLERCMTQRSWNYFELLRREKFLLKADLKISKCGYIVKNEGTLKDLEEQAERFARIQETRKR